MSRECSFQPAWQTSIGHGVSEVARERFSLEAAASLMEPLSPMIAVSAAASVQLLPQRALQANHAFSGHVYVA